MNESVIIYRSKFEQQRDEFYFANPEYALYAVGIAVAIVAIAVIGDFLVRLFKSRKY